MGLFTFISLVLIIKFTGAVNGKTTEITKDYGESFTIWESRIGVQVVEITATHNNIDYNLRKIQDDHLEFRRGNNRYRFRLNNINSDYAGEWRINSLTDDFINQIRSYDVVHLRVAKSNEKLLPTNNLTGEEGSYAIVYFENYFDNIKSCYLESHENPKKYILGDKSNRVDGLEIYGKCGVRMRLNSSWPTEWTLNQENNNNGVMSARFTINYKPKLTPTEQKFEFWHIGSKQKIIGMSSDVNFCEIEKPNGLVVSLYSDKCIYSVKRVDFGHGGTWKLRYVPKHSMDVVNQEIIVSVIDSQKIDWDVTQNEDGLTQLQCQTYLEEIKYCLFTTPSNDMINVLPAFGNEKYKYYGTTHRNVAGKDYAQCGLTILNPSDDVNGVWTCTVRSNTNSLITSNTYVSTNEHKEIEVESLRIATDNIFVKLGEDFTIKCETERPLDYCLLLSPNGTIYSVTKNRGNVPNHLPYNGKGLSYGVCGAYIEEAHKAHDGEWTCRLGVSSEDSEIESTFSVTVTDAYVMPQKKTINIAIDEEPKLLVSVLPNKDLTIKYCRWVHPIGERFFEGNVSKYPREQNETSCSVSLKEVNQDDLGTWSCYVKLNIGSDGETYTTIELVNEGQTRYVTVMNASVVILSILTIICGIICGFLLYKKRNQSQLKMKPTSPLTENEFQIANSYSIPEKNYVN